MILVVGGTGRLGKDVVRRLIARGERVRVLARHAAKTEVADAGVEYVVGDVRDPEAVTRAMVGVRVVVSAMHGFAADPRGIDGVGNTTLIDAARANDVEHFILVSVHGASPDHPIEMFRMKHLAEQQLTSSSSGSSTPSPPMTMAWTILRPTAFMETWLMLLGAPLLTKGKTTIFGNGTNPINFVSATDVARYVELAIANPEPMRGRTIEITGPENLSFSQLVETFERETGRSGKKSHIPLPIMRVMSWVMRPFNPSLARQIRAGVVMDTQAFDAADDADGARQEWSVPPTTLAEVIQREYGGPNRGSIASSPLCPSLSP